MEKNAWAGFVYRMLVCRVQKTEVVTVGIFPSDLPRSQGPLTSNGKDKPYEQQKEGITGGPSFPIQPVTPL